MSLAGTCRPPQRLLGFVVFSLRHHHADAELPLPGQLELGKAKRSPIGPATASPTPYLIYDWFDRASCFLVGQLPLVGGVAGSGGNCGGGGRERAAVVRGQPDRARGWGEWKRERIWT